MNTPSLPTELWITVTRHVLGNDSHPGRFFDLAQLSWTCRSAYHAARPFLWQRLCLVFRHSFEYMKQIEPRGLPYERDMDRVHICRHQEVMDSSVFPRYRPGQLQLEGERVKRIRNVSVECPHLQPFVVLHGKLYLASLLDKESNPANPNLAGIKSLWGQEAPDGVRMEGGLVLFPYPLHLVTELIMDVLASGETSLWDSPKLYETLPFILSMDPKQIRTFRFYSEVDHSDWDAYHAITDWYNDIVRHDYFLPVDSCTCPAFGPATRHVRILHGCYFDDEELFNIVAHLPQLASLEILGVVDFNLKDEQESIFSSSTLQQLVLDCEMGELTAPTSLQVLLPKLQELALSFELATLLFERHPEFVFPAEPTVIAFPSLTHLTLVDIEDRKVCKQVGEHDKVPSIPFHHMPNLRHVHIPLGHRGFDNTHCMRGTMLQSLARHPRVQSFVARGLVRITSDKDQDAHEPVVAQQLIQVQVAPELAGELHRWIVLPRANTAPGGPGPFANNGMVS